MVKRLLLPAEGEDGASSSGPLVQEVASRPHTNLLDLVFYRQAVRRFLFSNNIPLASLAPEETISLDLMHPIIHKPVSSCASPRASPCAYAIKDGLLEISSCPKTELSESACYVGGVNPYAVYELDVREIDFGHGDESQQCVEVLLDIATACQQTRLQVAAVHPNPKADQDCETVFEVRLIKYGIPMRTLPLKPDHQAPTAPYKLHIQLAGISLNAFYSKNGHTRHLGRIHPNDNFRDILDLRRRRTALGSTFNVFTRLPQRARVILGGASSYLSAGIGQADIRNITYRDGAPYFDDGGRLWFTFTARGLGTGDCTQGVMSLDPSAPSDYRFEGTIVFDHGDGLLRNDYASHLFYDEHARLWRAWSCDFGGSKNCDGRAHSGLVVAESTHDPRRGFSVMRACALPRSHFCRCRCHHHRPDIQSQPQDPCHSHCPHCPRDGGFHEDPCVLWDARAQRWRLLTADLENGFRATLFEACNWQGPWVEIAEPVPRNSTGTLIQLIGRERYVLAGSTDGAVFVYSYPELRELGTLCMDHPPFKETGIHTRVWPNVVPLPEGYPTRYLALMMDRANFPEVKGDTWSYGAMYVYWAFTEDISGTGWEFSPTPR